MNSQKYKALWQSVRQGFRTKAFRAGGYSVAAAAILLAILIVVNLLVGQLPYGWTHPDLSQDDLYSFSEQTKKLCKGLKEEVTLYFVTQSGAEDATVQAMLLNYDSLSENISVYTVDSVEQPGFTSQFTDAVVNDNSVIAVCGERHQVVDYGSMYQAELTDAESYTYSTIFTGESYVTAAIGYVVSEKLPVVYALKGHGETVETTIAAAIARENLELKDLNLIAAEKVPEDAQCLLLCAPKVDLSAEETKKLLAYLEAGGKLMLVTDYTGKEMPNLAAVMENYGVQATDGLVFEGDLNYCYASNLTHYLLPAIEEHAITAPLLGNYYVLAPMAQGILPLERYRDSVEITDLLVTSDKAYVKADTYTLTSYEKAEGDLTGSFALGVAITEEVEGGATQIVWLSSGAMLQNENDLLVAGSNVNLFLNGLDWMCEHEEGISVRPKTITQRYLTLSAAESLVWQIVMIFVLPLTFVGIGIVVWRRRRRK